MKLWLAVTLILFLSGCGTVYDDNPRNMRNMTAEQIERAVAGE
ncbi:hypothetical protein [Mesorhizobium sp.]|nr:hypothetical protein [Mesorhizobium sp.]